MKLLKTEEISETGPHLSKEWVSMERCSCFSKFNKSRVTHGRGDASMRRKLNFTSDESPCKEKIDHSSSRK